MPKFRFDAGEGAFYKIDDFSGDADVFFLTHIHNDHLGGLHDGWNRGRVCCSKQTFALLKTKFKGLNSSCFEVVEMNRSHIIRINSKVALSIFAINANHTPGSVMFHVSGSFGNRLHSGDFRFDPKIHNTDNFPCLSRVDELYLDTTLFHPSWSFSLTKEQSCEIIVNIIREFGSDREIHLVLDYFGQESIIKAIYKAFEEKIFVNLEAHLNAQTRHVWTAWSRSSHIKHAVTTKKDSSVRFHACSTRRPRAHSNPAPLDEEDNCTVYMVKKTFCKERKQKFPIIIRPSTLAFSRKDCEQENDEFLKTGPIVRVCFEDGRLDQYGIFRVFYSMHATHSELCNFYDITGKPEKVYQGMPGQVPERIANEKLEDSMEMSKISHGSNQMRLRTVSDGTNMLYGEIDFDKESVYKVLKRTEEAYREWFSRTFELSDVISGTKHQRDNEGGETSAAAGTQAPQCHDRPSLLRIVSLKQAGRQYARIKYQEFAESNEFEKENAVNR
eukprot:747919-Hanusia_phi.AAC.3